MTDRRFLNDIEKFNGIYKLPSNERPTLLGPERIENFEDILAEEVREGAEIRELYKERLQASGGKLSPEDEVMIFGELADWLGDVVVYCASECRRWGLPLNRILEVIMQSNFSKLGADGEPIYDERGKVMKGPDYWKPEPKLREMLKDL